MFTSLWSPAFLAPPALLWAGGALLVLAWQDLSRRRLPNAWVGAYAALFLLYAWGSGMGWAQLGSHVLLSLVAVELMAGLFALRITGGGDVKLWGALLLWTGPQGAFTAIVIATLCGGLLGVLGIIARQVLKFRRKPLGAELFRMLTAARGIPYGVGLSLAGMQYLWVAASGAR